MRHIIEKVLEGTYSRAWGLVVSLAKGEVGKGREASSKEVGAWSRLGAVREWENSVVGYINTAYL